MGNIQMVTAPPQNQYASNTNCPTSLPTPVWSYHYTAQPSGQPTPFVQQYTSNRNQEYEVLQKVTTPVNNVPYNVTLYDTYGNPKTVLDGNNNAWALTYNPSGQVLTGADPMPTPEVYTYGYNTAGDLTSIKDPNLNTWTFGSDYVNAGSPGIGETTSVLSPLNELYTFQYDADGRLFKSQDPAGYLASKYTTYNYDANSRVTSITDEGGSATTYTYPSNVSNNGSVCYPWSSAGNCWTYFPDTAGRMSTVFDPRGLETVWTLDHLNRATLVTYNAANNHNFNTSTTQYYYDAGNRIYKTVDTYSGTTLRSFDQLDELVTESVGSNSINYCYDSAGRRTNTNVNGKAISYGYDTANDLQYIWQANGWETQIAYDAAGRRAAEFLPYNAWEYYGYDAASNLKSIQEYNAGTNTNLYLNYNYDSDERVSSMSGPLATVNMPSTSVNAGYTASRGNQMLTWNGQGISYDLNGNMLNDPSLGIAMLYDERNHAMSASGASSYSFTYDDIGRRLTLSAASGNETYVHDGDNIAYTTGTGSYSSYDLFEGLGLDDYFSIAINGNTLGNSAQAILHDALGSTTATEGLNGQIYGTYQYGPFGSSSVGSNSPGAGPFQYGGRELDPTGLYFMRARILRPPAVLRSDM